jgi:hypothetical protein
MRSAYTLIYFELSSSSSIILFNSFLSFFSEVADSSYAFLSHFLTFFLIASLPSRDFFKYFIAFFQPGNSSQSLRIFSLIHSSDAIGNLEMVSFSILSITSCFLSASLLLLLFFLTIGFGCGWTSFAFFKILFNSTFGFSSFSTVSSSIGFSDFTSSLGFSDFFSSFGFSDFFTSLDLTGFCSSSDISSISDVSDISDSSTLAF